ncbi:hypothetical protein RvY_02812 [Ramazzottius varieornatus]|uniref:Uncharacterized protein n=1 Tax=Ramazzottius varieornatus TaxID=947166 RepID=A0A1D1URQ7_RAMVA|nr:hypothetical protein RvY_02812 [Ramazzottius varieornatus]
MEFFTRRIGALSPHGLSHAAISDEEVPTLVDAESAELNRAAGHVEENNDDDELQTRTMTTSQRTSL